MLAAVTSKAHGLSCSYHCSPAARARYHVPCHSLPLGSSEEIFSGSGSDSVPAVHLQGPLSYGRDGHTSVTTSTSVRGVSYDWEFLLKSAFVDAHSIITEFFRLMHYLLCLNPNGGQQGSLLCIHFSRPYHPVQGVGWGAATTCGT